ncbi:MAG TPA: sigma-70 family RNA polymerase sigma factor [Umezawaea sp.]|nr:sigma-70 family RNA polymerase sigma factor [Umezawaea sp.]
MTLPLTIIDSEDRLVALLREAWLELAAYTRSRLAASGLSFDKVDDLMQDAAADLVGKWRTQGELHHGQAMAMLKRSVAMDVIDLGRHRSRRTIDSLADLTDQVLLQHLERASNTEYEILTLLGRIDHERLVQQLPTLLDERERAAIVAVHIDGATQPQAAEELGITVRALQMRLTKACQQLRRHLEPSRPAPTPHLADPTIWETPR